MSKDKNKPNKSVDSVGFMVAEHSQIFEEFRRVRTEGVRRLNFFVTLSTGVLGGLVFLTQFSSLSLMELQILGILSISLLTLLGWDIFRYLISREISSDFNMRSMGLIRRFFIEHNPEIADYLLWNTSDEPSFFLKRERSLSSIITTMVYFLGVMVALNIGIIMSIFLSQMEIIIAVGGVILIISISLLRIHAKKRIKNAYTNALESSKFPPLSQDTDDEIQAE